MRGRGIKSRGSRTTSKSPWRSSLRSTLIYDLLSNLLFLSHAYFFSIMKYLHFPTIRQLSCHLELGRELDHLSPNSPPFSLLFFSVHFHLRRPAAWKGVLRGLVGRAKGMEITPPLFGPATQARNRPV